MRRLLLTVSVALAAVLGGFYQLTIKPKLSILGYGRKPIPMGNTKCKTFSEAEACEKIKLHESSGLLYMACSTQESRRHWVPTLNRLNSTGRSLTDYIAVYDPSTERITRLRMKGFKSLRGLSVHGMDVVHSALRPEALLIYVINHRDPMPPLRAEDTGPDSVIEVFRTEPGSEEMEYVETFCDPVISTPNDVVAMGDDKSFFFTNDHGFIKTGLARRLALGTLFGLSWSNVGYCHAEHGCKVAISNLVDANGITKDEDGKYYVASSTLGQLYVLERQADNTLVIIDIIRADQPIDNLSIDKDGAVWAAAIIDAVHMVTVHIPNPKKNSPSSALRISLNDGEGRYFGEKYKVEKILEDDGHIASGSTSVVYDARRKKLYMHGIAAPHLTVCDLD